MTGDQCVAKGETMIARPALRYHGAKWKLAKWIVGHLPAHRVYVEPYGGSAAVLLNKPRSWLEVYNDLDHQVVGFFRTLREQPEALIRAIELTPYAKEEWEIAHEESADPVERARRFYVMAYQNIAGPTAQWSSGWRRQKAVTTENGVRRMTPAAISFADVDHLWEIADRLRGVQIECDEALAVIERYDAEETLFYVDPPYVASTRGRWAKTAYRHEMTDREHCELARALRGVNGMVVLSGYDCELYAELYGDWVRVSRETRTNSAGSATEMLWLSPNGTMSQMGLWEGLALIAIPEG